MKAIIMVLLSIIFGMRLHAQQNEANSIKHSLLDKIQALELKNNKFNVYFNFQSSFDAIHTINGWETSFKARQLRLEMKGDLTQKLYYRFRHRLNRNNVAQTLDNLSRATDIMYVGYRLSNKFDVIFGKQCQAWGSFEFDINPMNIYEYSDFIEHMDNFMLGINFVVKPISNHEFQIQITDTRNSIFSEIYPTLTNEQVSQSPLTYIFNWNGSMFSNLLQTRWAVGLETEAKNKYSKMITIGNKLNFEHFQIALDYMFAYQDIDRLGYATQATENYLTLMGQTILKNVSYNTFIIKAEYQPSSKWNIFVKGMYETASVQDASVLTNNFRKSYGYFAGLEYQPFQEEDFRLFFTYVGRKYSFKTIFTPSDYDTNRISIGIMYRIKVF